MKYYKRSKEYRASNVSFNPESMTAYSYAWWRFVDRIGDKVVFNSYRYSPSTGQHQSKIRSLMESLNIKIDFVVDAPKGLQNLNSAVGYYEAMIREELNAISNPRSRKSTNESRAKRIRYFQKQIEVVKGLGV